MGRQVDLTVFNKSTLFTRKKIFKNRASLSYKFVPKELPHRDKEARELGYYLGYAMDGEVPTNLLILGHTGTGKTATTLNVLQELEAACSDVVICYTVAGGTSYRVLTSMISHLSQSPPPRGISFEEAWYKFKQLIGDRITIVVLDELDRMLVHDSTLLYYLSREPNVCIVAISNRVTVLDMIADARVLSSYNPYKITFNNYNQPQLEDILRMRAEIAFYDGVLDESVIPFCAAKGAEKGGDARYALDILMFAGDLAVKSECDTVTLDHARRAIDEVENEFVRRSLLNLSISHKLLLLSVILSKKHTPSEVYAICNSLLSIFENKTLTQRRLADFLRELELYGFVGIDVRGRGWSKGTTWIVQLADTMNKKMIFEVLKKDISEYHEIDGSEFIDRVKLALSKVRNGRK